MDCKICGHIASPVFSVKIMNKYDGEYFQCPECKFMFAGDPFWINEAYKHPINLADTGLLARNIYFSKIISVLISFYFDSKGTFLDYAGGYGIFTRLMRDIGFNFYWYDPYCSNLTAAGFEYDMLSFVRTELITAFEVFEHLADPLKEIKRMLTFSKNIIFSTELLPSPTPAPEAFWYYGFDHGQHISFYTPETLFFIAGKSGLNYYNLGGLHIFTTKKISLPMLKLMKKGSGYLFPFIKKKMKSLTFEDHVKMTRTV